MSEQSTSLSKGEAKRLVLGSQGLLKQNMFGKGTAGVLNTVGRLGYVQIDTLSVVQRAHHHVLRSRVTDYAESMIFELQARERSVFEYWSHAAAFLPMRDYRYYLPIMHGYAKTRQADRKLSREVLARIKSEGPQRARDFEPTPGQKSSGWWDWKPAKKVLEHLFLSGELMVTERIGFQKVYDFPENVLPFAASLKEPSAKEWARYHVLLMIGALGLATQKDLFYAKSAVRWLTTNSFKPDINQAVRALLEEGKINLVHAAGEEHFVEANNLEMCQKKAAKSAVLFLSPFDNLVINRVRTQRLFDFDYQIECYVPEQKRRYGYFSLPILWGENLIGRMDAKADRKQKTLLVKHLHLEDSTQLVSSLVRALCKGLLSFQAVNGCENLTILKTQPRELKRQMLVHFK